MSLVRKFGMGRMIKQVRRSMGKNWGSIKNLGEHGWWGNWEIFGSLRNWVKYGGNMEEVGKCEEGMGKYVGMWGRCRECGEVWGGVGEGVVGGVEKCMG